MEGGLRASTFFALKQRVLQGYEHEKARPVSRADHRKNSIYSAQLEALGEGETAPSI